MPKAETEQPQVDMTAHKELFAALGQATEARLAWTKREEELKKEARKLNWGDAKEALIDGAPVATYQPIDKFAEATFIRENPELAKHYLKPVVTDQLDVDLIRRTLPDQYDRYRVWALRNNYRG